MYHKILLIVLAGMTIVSCKKKTPDEKTYSYKVTLKDVMNGVDKKLKIPRLVACPHCKGTGAKDGTAFSYNKTRSSMYDQILPTQELIYQRKGKTKWFVADSKGTALSCARAMPQVLPQGKG